MAAKKKSRKPAANPARGFATTSLASKPRTNPAPDERGEDQDTNNARSARSTPSPSGPEELEAQLDESALQVLVDKYTHKVKRDAARQTARLETDRRLLRGQAEPIDASKWLPQELMDHVLALIRAEARFAACSVASEGSSGRLPSEEDLIIRLWTLQKALEGAALPTDRIQPALAFIVDMVHTLPASSTKGETVWGLDEALDWLARECSHHELPDYGGREKPMSQPLAGPLPGLSGAGDCAPTPTGAHVPSPSNSGRPPAVRPQLPKKPPVRFDQDMDLDQLLPNWIDAKSKLFALQRPRQGKRAQPTTAPADEETEALLQSRIDRIEKDPFFDGVAGNQQWRATRIRLERAYGEARTTEKQARADQAAQHATDHAANVLAAGLESDEEPVLADFFASLPTNEVDAVTGKTSTVAYGADGSRLVIRDFGTWAGLSPVRILDEACRARDSLVCICYQLISDVPFANRHMLHIRWSKRQDVPPPPAIAALDVVTDPTDFFFTMLGISCPHKKQSEAYIATIALFCIFASSAREEKVGLRLPAAWKDVWAELAEAKKNKSDADDRRQLQSVRHLVRNRLERKEEDAVVLASACRPRRQPKAAADSAEPKQSQQHDRAYYQAIWDQKRSSPPYQEMLQSRMQLPIWRCRQAVVDAIDQNRIVIICGETGCGKSTQTPSFILEHELAQGRPCKIYCAEPRRISALSLAKRVSAELGEPVGHLGTNRSLVGYSVRLESVVSPHTRLVYATTGIVMRMLEASGDLSGLTHLILDEIHERSIDGDFLLLVLKTVLARRTGLKVVLMSATAEAERLSHYLAGAPVLSVPGRTFPVRTLYLEDAVELTGYAYDQRRHEPVVPLDDDGDAEPDHAALPGLVDELQHYSARTRATLSHMDEFQIDLDLLLQLLHTIATDEALRPFSKAILVFMPGIADIRALLDLLLGHRFFAHGWLLCPLHSSMATDEQEVAFLLPPPGMRKIVVATNIAETGITIPDVTCVVDSGRHREMRFDERRQLSRLIDTFISRASAKQRRGRAGRVQEGLCFHLFTKRRHDRFMNDHQTPEMLRLSLQNLAIRAKMCCKTAKIEETLREALDPPSAKNIRRAIDALVDVRALHVTYSTQELTPLGRQLARLPLDVFLGKLVLYGAIFQCLDMAVTVAAILSSKSPFVAPFARRNEADKVRKAFRRGDSDLLTVYNAYQAWKRVCQAAAGNASAAEAQFCRHNFLAPQTLAAVEELKGQLLVALVDAGFLQLTSAEQASLRRLRFAAAAARGARRPPVFFEVPQRVNINSDNDTVAQSVIASSFYPNLLVRDVPRSKALRNLGNNQSISLHPTSVNQGHVELKWLSYYHIMQANKNVYNAHETTAVEPLAMALLCGDVRVDMYAGVLVLDGNRARFAFPDWKTTLAVKVLRARLHDMLTRSFKNPGCPPTAQHEKWLAVWQTILTLLHEQKMRLKERLKEREPQKPSAA